MNPVIELHTKINDEIAKFTLRDVDVSIANSIRRTLLSDIPMVVFRTTPYEKNKANIITNTSRLNNEIIKQRLSCIPIHIRDVNDFPIKNYMMEVNVENDTDTIMFVTTKDFKIKDLVTDQYLSEDRVREIFPADDHTGYFIDFVRLRPKISDDIPGEKLHLTCEFDVGSAKEDGMFNSVSTCSYGNTVDAARQDAELIKLMQTWKDEGKKEKEIEFESANWKLLEGKRIFLQNSFDFVLQSVGVHSNGELLLQACQILMDKFNFVSELINNDELEIKSADNTILNSFDIILENEDYTIGRVLEFMLLDKYYKTKVMTFCGFKKMHPHDSYSIIRVAYAQTVDLSVIKGNLIESIEAIKQIYTTIRKECMKLVPR